MESRKSNLELLRIIAMLLIVAHHFVVHSGFVYLSDTLFINQVYMRLLGSGGKIGVNIFVIICGYFLVTRADKKYDKLKKLWCEVFFYGILIYCIYVVIGLERHSLSAFVKNLFPITFDKWWFISTYFVLYLLYPYLNRLFANLNKNEYKNMLILMTVLWCIIPTFMHSSMQSNNLIWFIYLYAIGGYIRLHKDDDERKKYLTTAIVFSVFYYLISALFFVLGTDIKVLGEVGRYFSSMQHLFTLLMALLWFLAFESYKGKNDIKVINTIASATLGIYLIHDNEFVREFIWRIAFDSNIYLDTLYFIPYSLFVICFVFFICMVIDMFRNRFLEKYYLKLFYRGEKLIKWIGSKIFL